jgi:hypothetical protein
MVSQALMPKRCNVLLETVKESPPLQVLKIKGDGLCHDRTVSRRLWSGLSFRLGYSLFHAALVQRSSLQSRWLIWHFNAVDCVRLKALRTQRLAWYGLSRHHPMGDDVLREVVVSLMQVRSIQPAQLRIGSVFRG